MSAEMSKMPEPTYIYHPSDVYGEDDLFEFAKSGDVACPDCINLYTATQMREYAQEAARQAMERCASVCKSIKYDGKSNEHYEEGAGDCYDAIRALLPQSEKRHG